MNPSKYLGNSKCGGNLNSNLVRATTAAAERSTSSSTTRSQQVAGRRSLRGRYSVDHLTERARSVIRSKRGLLSSLAGEESRRSRGASGEMEESGHLSPIPSEVGASTALDEVVDEASSAATAASDLPAESRFRVGDTVRVARRNLPGKRTYPSLLAQSHSLYFNTGKPLKEERVGWITEVVGDGTYHVRYIVGGGRERGVEERFISLESADSGQRVKQPRCRVDWCPCFPIDCGHDQSDEMVAQANESNESAKGNPSEADASRGMKRNRQQNPTLVSKVKRYRGLDDGRLSKENDVNRGEESASDAEVGEEEEEEDVEEEARDGGGRSLWRTSSRTSRTRISVLEQLPCSGESREARMEEVFEVTSEDEDREEASEGELSDVEVFDVEASTVTAEPSFIRISDYRPVPREDFDGRVGLEGVEPPSSADIDLLRSLLERGGDFLVEEGRTIPSEYRPFVTYTLTLDLRQCCRVMKTCYLRSCELYRCLRLFHHRIFSLHISSAHDSVVLARYLMDMDDDLFVFGNEIEFMKITYDQAYKQFKRIKKRTFIPETDKRKVFRLNSLCDGVYSYLSLREEKARMDKLFLDFEKCFNVSASVLASNLAMEVSDSESATGDNDDSLDLSIAEYQSPLKSGRRYPKKRKRDIITRNHEVFDWCHGAHSDREDTHRSPPQNEHRAPGEVRRRPRGVSRPRHEADDGELNDSGHHRREMNVHSSSRCEHCMSKVFACGNCDPAAVASSLPAIPLRLKAVIDAYIVGLAGQDLSKDINISSSKRFSFSKEEFPWAIDFIETSRNRAPYIDLKDVNGYVVEEAVSAMQYFYRLHEIQLILQLLQSLFLHPLTLDTIELVLMLLDNLEALDALFLNDFTLPLQYGFGFLEYLILTTKLIAYWCECHEHTSLEDFNGWKSRVHSYLYLGDARLLLSLIRSNGESNRVGDIYFEALVATLPHCDLSAPLKHRNKQHWEHINRLLRNTNWNKVISKVGSFDMQWLIVALHSHALLVSSYQEGRRRVTQNWDMVKILTSDGDPTSFTRAEAMAAIWDEPIIGFECIISERIVSMPEDQWVTTPRVELQHLFALFPSDSEILAENVPLITQTVFKCFGLKYPIMISRAFDFEDKGRLMLLAMSVAANFAKQLFSTPSPPITVWKKFIGKFLLDKVKANDSIGQKSFQTVYLMIKVSSSFYEVLMRKDFGLTFRDILNFIIVYCSDVKRQFIFDHKLLLLWSFAVDVILPHIDSEYFNLLLKDAIDFVYSGIVTDRGVRDIGIDLFMLASICAFFRPERIPLELQHVILLGNTLQTVFELSPLYFEQRTGIAFICSLLGKISHASLPFLR